MKPANPSGVPASGLPKQWEALIEEAVDAFAEGAVLSDRLPNAMAALREALADGVALPAPAQVADLAALVRQLVHSLRKAAPGHALPDRAVDYLKRHGLQGSPLRDGVLASPNDQPKDPT